MIHNADRRLAALALIASATLTTGCVTVESDPTATTSSSPAITVPPLFPPAGCGDDCDGKEPSAATQNCSGNGTTDAIPGKPIEGIGVTGTLSLRKAAPELCESSFWVRISPVSNTTPFTLVIYRNGKEYKPQPSQPGNPAMEAWTVMAQGKPGDIIRGCVENTETKKAFCLDDEKVTG